MIKKAFFIIMSSPLLKARTLSNVAAAVLASIGFSTMGTIASAVSGGTVYYNYQRFYQLLSGYQYRVIWSFIASTGDHYGDYIYHHQ